MLPNFPAAGSGDETAAQVEPSIRNVGLLGGPMPLPLAGPEEVDDLVPPAASSSGLAYAPPMSTIMTDE